LHFSLLIEAGSICCHARQRNIAKNHCDREVFRTGDHEAARIFGSRRPFVGGLPAKK
jgi:hypothetical protein